MSAFTSIKSAIFPWRRGPAISEPLMVDSPQLSPCKPPSMRKQLSADAPEFVPNFIKAQQVKSAEVAEKSAPVAEKPRFPWRRQISTGTDLGDDHSLSLSGASARQTSTLSTASTCATTTPECSGSSSDSNLDSSSVPSETESHDGEADEKLQDDTPKDEPQGSLSKRGLQVSPKSWAAALRARREKAEQGSEESHEEIVRKMKSILNKLTIEKFPTLSKQLISCGIRSHSHLEALIHEICEKATFQHHFVNMYADLCSVLQAHFANSDKTMNFKKILLNACQASFEKHLTPPASLKVLVGEELAAAEQLYKVQMIGNIKFVGALIVRKMLAIKVMFAIIEELLSDSTSEALESLAALLTVVGPSFDHPEFPQQCLLSAIFDQVEARTKDPCLKNRVRCLLKDVLELRAMGWQDRKPKKMEGPSTLDEVAQKFQTETETKNVQQPSFFRPAFNAVPVHDKWSQLRVPAPKPDATGMDYRQSVTPSYAARPAGNSSPVKVAQKTHIEVEPSSPSKQTAKAGPRQPSSPSNQSASSAQKVSSELQEKMLRFLSVQGVDEEAAEDLKACPAEIQEMVLAKGDVTSARNPSAMLRVRMNQAWRELKKKNKAAEPPQSSKSGSQPSQASAAKSDSTKSNAQAPKKKEKAQKANQEVPFDKTACHKELAAAYAELMTSHDVPEAVARIATVAMPSSVQSEELCDFLVFIVEQGTDARMVGFRLIVSLFTEKYWTAAALQEGLRSFMGMVPDLKLDVPILPAILCKEMASALQPLVSSGLLSAEQMQALSGSVLQ
mmetsp:Transcript_147129/g.274030  ORF Transcript_147129/g.274030 Transcript_147129/m.274030 type:complete len:788 (+) Transcript_147129:72-2435(+)